MTTSTSHSVPSTAAGFIYQFERALLHLACSAAGTVVGIETCDDVAVRSKGDLTLWEQDKLTFQPNANPLTDKSKNLWNSLLTWLNALRVRPQREGQIKLFLVTNAAVRQGLIYRISEARDEQAALACVQALRTSGTSKQGDVQSLMTEVLRFSDEELSFVVRHCTLLEGPDKEGDRTVIRQNTTSALQLPSGVCPDTMCQTLAGWLKDVVMDAWQQRRLAWVTHEAFNERKHGLILKYRKERVRERPEHEILVTESQRREAFIKRFVEHLVMISAADEAILDAVTDYIRFCTEYSRLLAAGEVGGGEWQAFFDDLVARWKPIFRLAKLNQGTDSEEVVGQRILLQTTGSDFRGTLGGQKTEHPYFTCGGYHRLAESDRVWWDPRFGAKPKENRQ